MKPHRFHPEADDEYAEAAAHYANIDLDLGGRFFDEIERLIAEACAAPRRFRRVDGEVNTRPSPGHPEASLGASWPGDRFADRARGIAEKNGASSGEWTRLRFNLHQSRLNQWPLFRAKPTIARREKSKRDPAGAAR